MSDAMDERSEEVKASDLDDAAIVRLIGDAIHEPFRAAWRKYDHDAWQPIRVTLEHVVAAHEKMLEGLGPDCDAGKGGAARADEALRRYRRAAASDVLEPLHVALGHAALSSCLCQSLTETEGLVRKSAAELPRSIEAPLSTSALHRRKGVGVARAIKILFARALRPLVWRNKAHDVPVADLALMHLNRVVGPWQAESFRETQPLCAAWLGQLERAWSDWMLVVLSPELFEPTDAETGSDPTSRHAEIEEEAAAILRAGEALQGELQSLLASTVQVSGLEIGEDQAHLDLTLSGEVATAGTFLGRRGSAPGSDGSDLVDCWETAGDWDAWTAEAAARLELHRGLLAANVGAEAIRDRLLRAWEDAAKGIVVSVLGATEATLRSGVERMAQDDGGRERRRILENEREGATEALRRLQEAIPDGASLTQILVQVSEEGVDALEALSRQLPETLTHHSIPEVGERVGRPKGGGRTVRPREAAHQAFDALRVERIRTASTVLAEAMDRVRADVDELCEVVAYGFEAGIAELEGRDVNAPMRSVGLATDGLSRAADKIAAAPDVLSEALAVAEARLTDEVDEGLARLIQRVMADRMTGGLLDARSRLTGMLAEWWEQLARWLRHLSRVVYAWLLREWRNLRRYLERGASALGIQAAPGTTERSVRTLSSAESFVRTLPLVYQRLFAFEPLNDPQLLTGREEALETALDVWQRWRAGEGASLIVIAPPGVGLSSFLNVLAARISEEAAEPVKRTFGTRLRTEAEHVARLSGWLGIESVHDLETLADRVLEGEGRAGPSPGTGPDVVILEGLEHLHLRAPGGIELMERFLTFMARTQFRICWMVSVTSSAWQVIQKRAPAFVTDVERVVLDHLTADELRQAILHRHRRSGLPLRYVEPQAGRSLLRRRLRRLRGTDRHDELLEADYFDRLHRASFGSPRLGLFLWLRSADFTLQKGELHVQPPEALSFSFLDDLDLTQSFALKAILDHGTLTLDEYCEVARATPEESLHVFESLESRHAIEPSAVEEGSEPVQAGRHGVRFRVRPLMTEAVVAHLRTKNILH